MTQQAELYREINTLPPKYLGEIFALVTKLQTKAQQTTPKSDQLAVKRERISRNNA